MIKTVTCKCIIFSTLAFGPAMFAGEYKLRALSVPKVKKSHFNKKAIIETLNVVVGGNVDFSFFDKKKDGLSVYAKVSKISKVGLRYRF